MLAEQTPSPLQEDEAVLARERFLTDPEKLARSWDRSDTELRFKQLAEERLRLNHPDLARKHDGNNPLYSLEHDGSMLTAVWLIMIVRENHWRRWQREQQS